VAEESLVPAPKKKKSGKVTRTSLEKMIGGSNFNGFSISRKKVKK